MTYAELEAHLDKVLSYLWDSEANHGRMYDGWDDYEFKDGDLFKDSHIFHNVLLLSEYMGWTIEREEDRELLRELKRRKQE